MSCCNNCSSGVGNYPSGKMISLRNFSGARKVQAVGGFWSSLGSGFTNFLGSGLGQSVLQIGTTLGTAALTEALFDGAGNSNNQQAQQQNAAPSSPSSPTQPYYGSQPPITAVAVQPTQPDYTMPIAIGAIALVAVIFLTRK